MNYCGLWTQANTKDDFTNIPKLCIIIHFDWQKKRRLTTGKMETPTPMKNNVLYRCCWWNKALYSTGWNVVISELVPVPKIHTQTLPLAPAAISVSRTARARGAVSRTRRGSNTTYHRHLPSQLQYCPGVLALQQERCQQTEIVNKRGKCTYASNPVARHVYVYTFSAILNSQVAFNLKASTLVRR
jgi:hypothetical protein